MRKLLRAETRKSLDVSSDAISKIDDQNWAVDSTENKNIKYHVYKEETI
jgi:hypothetical protein